LGAISGHDCAAVGSDRSRLSAISQDNILDGLKEAGVTAKDVIIYNRYRQETLAAKIDQWIPQGVRQEYASEAYNNTQLDMDNYDRDHYMEMSLIKPGENWSEPHFRRSYVAKTITQRVNKFINMCVLKHHQVEASAAPFTRRRIGWWKRLPIFLGGRDGGVKEYVARHGEQCEPQPHDAHVERVRHLHPVGGGAAGDSREGGAAHLRRGESVVPRRPGRAPAVRVGAQEHLLRDGPGGVG
jgi:hypothetical protein